MSIDLDHDDAPAREFGAGLHDETPADPIGEARADLEAGRITAIEFIERTTPLLAALEGAADTPRAAANAAPGLVRSLADAIPSRPPLAALGIGVGALGMVAGAFVLGLSVSARAASR